MTKVAPPTDKYFLRSLHQEIDFFDRKLAYLDKYADFANLADRDEAEVKLLQKRAALEKTARELAAAGVEFSEADLPRSFRAQGDHGKHTGETLS
jgi:sulfite reductase beta subunit-like hemoprotein